MAARVDTRTETFQVYSFGSNSHGQLGIPDRRQKNVPSPVLLESFQGRRRIKQIACGNISTWQLLENGECYAWGELPGLGYSATSRSIPVLKDKIVKHVSSSLSTNIYTSVVYDNGESACWPKSAHLGVLAFDGGLAKQIVCTGTHFLALLENGWVVQRDHPLPMGSVKEHQVLGPEKGIVAIAAHDLYGAALSDTGELYTWGIGPLGHRGSSNPIKPKPEKVLGALENKKVISVACGREHMVCVTDTGELYTWGSATRHQLGQGEVGARVSEPQRVQALTGKKIVSCSCGDYFSACISDTGVLYTFGDGSSGALGHTEFNNEPFPRLVEAFKNKTVTNVICGAQHTVCIVLADVNQNQSLLMKDIGQICQAEELRGGHTLGADESFYDVKLRCTHESHRSPILAHKAILAARCPDLQDRLRLNDLWTDNDDISRRGADGDEDIEEIAIDGMDYDTLVEFVRYLYTDRVSPELEDRLLLLLSIVGERYNLPRLQIKCQALWEQGIVSVSSAEAKLALLTAEQQTWESKQSTDAKSMLRLRQSCLDYILRQICDKPQSASSSLSSSQSSTANTALLQRQLDAMNNLLLLSERCTLLENQREGKAQYHSIKAGRQIKANESTTQKDEDGDESELQASQDEEISLADTDTVTEDDKIPLGSLGVDLEKFICNKRFADIVFQVEDMHIPAHKAVICARCPHFRAMLTSGMREAQSGRIVVPDISSSAFSTVLKYIYTGRADINEDNVIELLIISNIYSILQLQEQCESYIESGIQLDNVTDLLQMAHQFQTHHLRSVAINYLMGRLKGDFSKLEGFSELSQDIQDEFKRGLPCPEESLIKAKTGGFQGKRFYFTVISRDFFKKRVLTGQEKWDIIVQYEGQHESNANAADKPLTSTTDDPVVQSGEEGEKPDAEISKSPVSPTVDYSFRPSHVGASSRARRGAKARSYAARDKSRFTSSSQLSLPPSPTSSASVDTSNETETAASDDSTGAQLTPFSFGASDLSPRATNSSTESPVSSGGHFIRVKRRGVKKAHTPSTEDTNVLSVGNMEQSSAPSCQSIATIVDQLSVLLTSNSDGTYTASFLPDKLGRYTIKVSLNGVPIKNSPFPLRIEKQIHSRNCRAAFAGNCASGITTAGKEVSLVIQSRDVQNKPISVGGAEPNFRVCVYLPPSREAMLSGNPSFIFNSSRQNLSDKGLVDIHVKDNKDGTYAALFILRRAGDFVVDVVRQEVSDKLRLPIFGSPFPITCFPASAHGPKCEVEGDGLFSAVLGQQATFRIRTFDRFSNIRDVGGDTFIVRIVKRGALTLIRNEEEEREKEEEKKREEESKSNEEKGSIDQKRQQQERQDDEVEDAAEVRREEERQKKKKEFAERKKQQAQEWAKLEEQLQEHELGRGIVVDEGNGTYTATYVIDVPLLRRQRLLETPSSVSENTGESAADATKQLLADAEDDPSLIAFDPQGYQVIVTLEKGGMVRDSPFNILLLRDAPSNLKSDNQVDIEADSSSSALQASSAAEQESNLGGLRRVTADDENDRFVMDPLSFPNVDQPEEAEEEEQAQEGDGQTQSSLPVPKGHLLRRGKMPRKGSLLMPASSSSLDPPFSPPIFIPTSPRPSSAISPTTPTNSLAFSPLGSPSPSPSTPASLPPFTTPSIALPAPTTPEPSTGFSTEIFSTMFTAHMEMMQDSSAFSFAPARSSSSTTQPFVSPRLSASPSSSQPFIFSSTLTTSTSPTPTSTSFTFSAQHSPSSLSPSSAQPSAAPSFGATNVPPPFSFGGSLQAASSGSPGTAGTASAAPTPSATTASGGDMDEDEALHQLRGKKYRGDADE